MAPLGRPPPRVESINFWPVRKASAAAWTGWGKRSASSFRRSSTFAFPAMEPVCPMERICSSEHYRFASDFGEASLAVRHVAAAGFEKRLAFFCFGEYALRAQERQRAN